MMKIISLTTLWAALLLGCASYSPGEFDFSGPYPLVRYADGTEYELASGGGYD